MVNPVGEVPFFITDTKLPLYHHSVSFNHNCHITSWRLSLCSAYYIYQLNFYYNPWLHVIDPLKFNCHTIHEAFKCMYIQYNKFISNIFTNGIMTMMMKLLHHIIFQVYLHFLLVKSPFLKAKSPYSFIYTTVTSMFNGIAMISP